MASRKGIEGPEVEPSGMVASQSEVGALLAVVTDDMKVVAA